MYTRNVPSSVERTPGDAHRRAFDLGDGKWEPAVSGGDSLAARFEIDETPESSEHGVWTGCAQSEAVDLG
jgi:hypothetical protein